MSPSEKSAYDAEMAAAKGKLAEIRVAKDDLAVSEKAAEISAAIGGVQGEGGGLGVKDRSQRLSFKNMGTMAAERILGGQKALGPSGSAVVAQSFEGYPVALGRF